MMRLRNFLFSVGFGAAVAVVLALFKQFGLALVFFAGQLIVAVIHDIDTVRGQKKQKKLQEQYPDIPRPDTRLAVGDKTVTLSDGTIKAALKNTIYPVAYENRKGEFLEKFYKAALSGDYSVQAIEIVGKELEPGNDSSDRYILLCKGERIDVSRRDYDACNVGDTLAAVTVSNLPYASVVFFLDPEDQAHRVISQKEVF